MVTRSACDQACIVRLSSHICSFNWTPLYHGNSCDDMIEFFNSSTKICQLMLSEHIQTIKLWVTEEFRRISYDHAAVRRFCERSTCVQYTPKQDYGCRGYTHFSAIDNNELQSLKLSDRVRLNAECQKELDLNRWIYLFLINDLRTTLSTYKYVDDALRCLSSSSGLKSAARVTPLTD